MSIETFIASKCVQTAVYWGTPVEDGYGGKTFADPVEISCRWEDKINVVSDGMGNEIVCKAVVHVTQDVDEQGYLFLGDLDDLDSDEEEDPRKVEGAYTIKRFDKSPALGTTDVFIRKAYL